MKKYAPNITIEEFHQEEIKENRKRLIGFGYIAFLVAIVNGILDYYRNLPYSCAIVISLGLLFLFLILLVKKGYDKYINATIVLSVNIALVSLVMVEGLKTGSYMYLLALFFALAFLLGNTIESTKEIVFYLILTIISFCSCVLFTDYESPYQHINPELQLSMFNTNMISIAILCAGFAYIGIIFEKKYRAALLQEKSLVEEKQRSILSRNLKLREIAYLNAHLVRAPLANILSLVNMMEEQATTIEEKEEIVTHIKTSQIT